MLRGIVQIAVVCRIGQYRSSLEAELRFLIHDVIDPRRPCVAYARNLETELTQTRVHLHHVIIMNV